MKCRCSALVQRRGTENAWEEVANQALAAENGVRVCPRSGTGGTEIMGAVWILVSVSTWTPIVSLPGRTTRGHPKVPEEAGHLWAESSGFTGVQNHALSHCKCLCPQKFQDINQCSKTHFTSKRRAQHVVERMNEWVNRLVRPTTTIHALMPHVTCPATAPA